jgi:hypothetical protein
MVKKLQGTHLWETQFQEFLLQGPNQVLTVNFREKNPIALPAKNHFKIHHNTLFLTQSALKRSYLAIHSLTCWDFNKA